jgi:cold shock CspA family protein
VPVWSACPEGQKVEFEEQRDPKRGKTSAVNLKTV